MTPRRGLSLARPACRRRAGRTGWVRYPVTSMLDQVLRRAREHRKEGERALFDLLKIPSVSALPEHREDVRRAADWLAARLRAMGMDTLVLDVEKDGHPIVAAEWLGRKGAPTLTIYGHYDVQPPDPLDEWTTPPFEPEVRDGFVYARGADDNKGQHMASVLAAEHWFAFGGPPINLRFLLEGEEEITGRSLPNFLHKNADDLKTDYLLVADGGFLKEGLPALCTGLRGMLYAEIEVTGPKVDLHSGIFGGVAPNPLASLSHILAGLKDREGTVKIPGFYDDVKGASKSELEEWSELGWLVQQREESVGAELVGEPSFSPLERNWVRPTLDVHGVLGGFQGAGAKTVIPSQATAKISMRLVPTQRPARIMRGLRRAATELALPGTRVRVHELSSVPAITLTPNHPGAEALRRAFSASFGAAPVLVREGGSIPVATDLQEMLGSKMLVTGFGLPDDALHSPNERFSLEQYHRATETVARLFHELAVLD